MLTICLELKDTIGLCIELDGNLIKIIVSIQTLLFVENLKNPNSQLNWVL